MKLPIHRRLRAAVMLLAFAIIAVVAGLFAIASPDPATTAPLAAIAIAATVAVITIAAVFRQDHETVIQAAFVLFIMASTAVMQAIGFSGAPFTHATAGPSIDIGLTKIHGRHEHLTNHRGRHVDRRRGGGECRALHTSAKTKAQRTPLKV